MLTEAEESAWRLCHEWSYGQGIDGPDEERAFVATHMGVISIVWTKDDARPDSVSCHTDPAGRMLRFGVIDGETFQP